MSQTQDDAGRTDGVSAHTLGEEHRVVRARGAVLLGVVSILGGLALAAAGLLDGLWSWRMIGIGGLFVLAGWLAYLRPRLVVHALGLRVVNPLSTTRRSFAGIDGVSTRWNLLIDHGDESVKVFALPRSNDRRRAPRPSRMSRTAEVFTPDGVPDAADAPEHAARGRSMTALVADELREEMERRERVGDGGEPRFFESAPDVPVMAIAALATIACLVGIVIG